MCTPAAACRLFAANAITPLYRDHCSKTLIADATIEGGQITGQGGPIPIDRTPAEGQIVFFNESQYVYKSGEKYEVRELTPMGKRLHDFAQYIGSVDEGIGWISLVGLVVVIAALILLPTIKTTAALMQWMTAVTATLATVSALIYQRRLVAQVS